MVSLECIVTLQNQYSLYSQVSGEYHNVFQVQKPSSAQNFKDLLRSTCQIIPESRVLDLESEVYQGPGFYSH